MPAPLLMLLLRTLRSGLLPAARLARQHLLPLLRRLAQCLRSQDVRDTVLGCLLFILSQRHSPDAGEASGADPEERRERRGPRK